MARLRTAEGSAEGVGSVHSAQFIVHSSQLNFQFSIFNFQYLIVEIQVGDKIVEVTLLQKEGTT